MKIYLYDNNFQFIKETYALLDVDRSREAGEPVYIIPNNSTEIAVPKINDNEKAFFINGEWVIKKDYRGKKFFDPASNRTVVITEIGEVPENYIDLASKDLINYINNVPFETLYNNVKSMLEKNTKAKYNQKVLIDKYYFDNNNISKYIKVLNEAIKEVNQIKKNIEAIEKSIEKQNNIEKINELKLEQIEKYKQIDSFKFNILIENKRNKEIEVSFSLPEFQEIVKKLQSIINKINEEAKNNLIKINKLSKYELVLFEQRLIKEELSYGATETKEDTETNS